MSAKFFLSVVPLVPLASRDSKVASHFPEWQVTLTKRTVPAQSSTKSDCGRRPRKPLREERAREPRLFLAVPDCVISVLRGLSQSTCCGQLEAEQ